MKYASENDWPALSSVVRPPVIFLVSSDTRIWARATMVGSTPARSKRARSASRPSVSRNSPISSSDETLEARYCATPVWVSESDRTRNPSIPLRPSRLGPYQVDEYFVERGLHQLEPRQPGAGGDEPLQDLLGVRPGRKLKLGVLPIVVDPLHKPLVCEDLLRTTGTAVEPDDEMVSATCPLDVAEGAVHELLPSGDDAELVAQLLGLLHDVRREEDRLPAPAQFQHRILHHLCVHRIEPR